VPVKDDEIPVFWACAGSTVADAASAATTHAIRVRMVMDVLPERPCCPGLFCSQANLIYRQVSSLFPIAEGRFTSSHVAARRLAMLRCANDD
jgi:hypothetical protein